MKKNSFKSLVLVIGCILLMHSLNLILENLLCSILYGSSICLIIGTFFNSGDKSKKKINIIIHFMGIIILTAANILMISSLLNSILFSAALIVLLSGTFIVFNL